MPEAVSRSPGTRTRALPLPAGARRVRPALRSAPRAGVVRDAGADALALGGVAVRAERDGDLGDVLLQPRRRLRNGAVPAVGDGARTRDTARRRLRIEGAGRRA